MLTGMDTGMKKITVEVPETDLAAAQAYTGEGISETVRAALQRLAQVRIQNEFRKLRGTVKFTMSWEEMKYDRE